MSKSKIPFTKLYTDQALEQENKVLKGQGGMVGVSQSDESLDRHLVTTPHIARMVQKFLSIVPSTGKTPIRQEHYQLSGQMTVRMRHHAINVRDCIERRCPGNTFTVDGPIRNISSSAILPEKVKDDILNFASKDQKGFEEFVVERLLLTSTSSV